MSRIYLKKAQLTAKSNASEVHETVKNILTDIEAGGDEKAKEYASRFDQYHGNIILTDEEKDYIVKNTFAKVEVVDPVRGNDIFCAGNISEELK